MCGILFYQGTKLSHQELNTAAESAKHRGPDFLGSYVREDIFMAHNRLSIIDVSTRSNQPFKIDHHVIIFNGEIYNYKELIQEHKLNVTTSSDTEVLLRMFLKYGEKCLDYFNGMFAFVIYNEVSKEYFIARDRLGIKPLYYSRYNGELIISSEIRTLKNLVPLSVNSFSIRQYKKLRMTVGQDTIYNEVSFFPAGSYMKNDTFYKYWNLEVLEKSTPNEEELKWLIEDAVRLRMRSDVPVSSYLSGGLDSTIITALAKPNSSWTIGFDELNEFKWSSIASNHLDVPCNQILVNTKQFLKTLEEMILFRKEPLSVPNEVLIYLMTKEARKQSYKVILSGEGADELFWGYDRIFKWANNIKELTVEGFNKMYCYGSGIDNEVVEHAMSTMPNGSPIQKIAHYFQKTHLHGLLRRVDNSTMMCSVEARVPFVDHRLIELMNGVPFEYKVGSSFKEPLKRMFSDDVPNEIINRPKVGFPVPLDKIFNTPNMPQGWDKWFEFNLNLCDV